MNPNAPEPPPGILKRALYVVMMAIVVSWTTFGLMPLAIGWEFPPAMVDRLPILGLCLGAVLGLAMGFSEPVRTAVWFVAASLVLGWLVWLFTVMIVGLGVSIAFDDEAFDRAMEPVNTVAIWLGALVAIGMMCLAAYAVLYERGALLKRFRSKQRN